ncbi:hypothetical protein GOBAR_AA36863 [Gossypium barbadense]|uniref:Uncharacterized protein n=1 Tax=Gossypium barbadense TaxID=3634 RepID=A0A2P5VYF6_GOSBA|nr:hypothetical protein GOBAR_AA36863 [Gossypium barbadense]
MRTPNCSPNEDDKGGACQNEKVDSDVVMAIDLDPDPPLSQKERMIGKSSQDLGRKISGSNIDEDDAFAFVEGDIMRSFVNSIPSIKFSERINQLLINDMAFIVVIKLLGRSIGYATL